MECGSGSCRLLFPVCWFVISLAKAVAALPDSKVRTFGPRKQSFQKQETLPEYA